MKTVKIIKNKSPVHTLRELIWLKLLLEIVNIAKMLLKMTSIFSKSALKTQIIFFSKTALKFKLILLSWVVQTVELEALCYLTLNIPQTFAKKRAWHSLKNRCIDKWDKIESTEINSYIHGQLIFNKDAKNTQRINDILLSKRHYENCTFVHRKIKWDSYSYNLQT